MLFKTEFDMGLVLKVQAVTRSVVTKLSHGKVVTILLRIKLHSLPNAVRTLDYNQCYEQPLAK